MQINRKDIGYTIYSRLEESFRSWMSDTLLNNFGDQWLTQVPSGIQDKAKNKSVLISFKETDDPADLLEETDIPDLTEIICHRNGFSRFVQDNLILQKDFQKHMSTLYRLRCKIAHVKQSFTAIDLDLLIETVEKLLPILEHDNYSHELKTTLDCIKTNPKSVVVHIPDNFFSDDMPESFYLHNLPGSDYDADGGFIGRKDDLKKISSLVLGDLDRVITISGAGGVGKTALAHKFCISLLHKPSTPFNAIVWISAKDEKLTLTGIEPIEPTIRNYEDLLDNILEVYGWFDILESNLLEKEDYVNLILQESDKGILLLVDNLETINDERIIEFIKNIPRPNKVLITSRMGLGEIERRYSLKEMSKTDAVTLMRTIAKEKGATSLVKLPENVLYTYAQKMSLYPLAIKWVVGQVALGKDIEQLVSSLTSTSEDIARFCFEYIYDSLLSDNAKMILHCLAAKDGALTRGVLTHVSGLQTEQLDQALRDLALASLVIPEQEKNEDDSIITSYSLLPLTLGYLKGRLQSQPDIVRIIQSRMELISGRIEEASKAGRQYRYTLRDLGATTDEERIAASWVLGAYQRYQQMNDYTGALDAFKRAAEIAPNFSRIYRNWAVVESTEGSYKRANELMEKATSLSPDDPTLWFVWGNIEKRQNRLDKARRYFEKALELSPNDGSIFGALGEIEKRNENFQQAHQYLQKALDCPQEMRSHKHQVITYTAIADNLRRWSEHLAKDKQIDLAVHRAQEGYNYASKASEMARSDDQARDTFRNVVFQLAKLVSDRQGIEAAYPYFQEAIVPNPKRIKERTITSLACYHLSMGLLQAGRKEEAKEYYSLGKRIRFRVDRYRDRYEALRAELFDHKSIGKLISVIEDKGYGFIEMDATPGQAVFVHISQITPKVNGKEFTALQGMRFSFTLKQTDRGPQAMNVKLIDE